MGCAKRGLCEQEQCSAVLTYPHLHHNPTCGHSYIGDVCTQGAHVASILLPFMAFHALYCDQSYVSREAAECTGSYGANFSHKHQCFAGTAYLVHQA